MCKLIILTSGMVGLAYTTELFIAFYSGNRYEQFAFINRATGPLAWGYYIMVGCNVIVPQLFWFPRVRRTLPVVFIISLLVNVGMWFERFIIIVSSLERDFLPSSWATYSPTSIEIATLVGSFGLFFTCFLLFCRFVPVIAIAEIKAVLHPSPSGRGWREAPGEGTRLHEPSPYPLPEGEGFLPSPLIAVFGREDDLLHAAAAARKEGLHIIDAFTPHAVHGLDRAMGLRPSRLPWVCFLLGLLGAGAILLFQYWTTAISWPLNVGGKPWNSLPAFIPVGFEVMVLCAGVGTVAIFIWKSGLRPGRTSALSGLRVTDDRFALAIGKTASFNRAAIEKVFAPFHPVAFEERAS